MKTQTTCPSDLIQIDITIPMGKARNIDRRSWFKKLIDHLLHMEPEPLYQANFKFLIQEAPFLRAGSTIITDNGLRWFVLARSLGSLICESVEDMTDTQIKSMEHYSGAAALFEEAKQPEAK